MFNFALFTLVLLAFTQVAISKPVDDGETECDVDGGYAEYLKGNIKPKVDQILEKTKKPDPKHLPETIESVERLFGRIFSDNLGRLIVVKKTPEKIGTVCREHKQRQVEFLGKINDQFFEASLRGKGRNKNKKEIAELKEIRSILMAASFNLDKEIERAESLMY